ncbi:hypothetical protein MRX96_032120 [Rhipicephalus microplus]
MRCPQRRRCRTCSRRSLASCSATTFRGVASWPCIQFPGGLAVDCVKLGHPEYVLGLVQALGLFVERDLATWISQQGGWGTLITRFRRRPQRSILVDFFLIVAGLVVVVVLLYYWLS